MHQQEHLRRRRQLMGMISAGSMAILPGAPEKIRSRDTYYPFRQDSDFHYLTGFDEPDAVAVLLPGRQPAEFVLFCRERDPKRELWDGPMAGPEGARQVFGAEDAFPIADIDEILPGLMEGCERIYYSMGTHPEFDQRVIGWMNSLRDQGRGTHVPEELVALDHLLHEMRLFKTRREQSAMRKAAKVAVAAHRRAMQVCRPGILEYQLQAEMVHEFGLAGAVPSYLPIVAGGANGCVLHYVVNRDRLDDGDLVLIDAGCELELYASDVTRTFPVNGRFTEPQWAVQEIVCDAQKAAIAATQPGNHWNDPHVAAVKVITRGLRDLGVLKGRLPSLIKSEAYKPFYMHRTGHWLGLDVHDVGDYQVDGEWRLLEAGMVTTVEPGIYISPQSRGVARRFKGIGVRIEDDVLITRAGNEVLSAGVPKWPAEVEAFMASVP
jgi:Xaa-Pro aminopeptidase